MTHVAFAMQALRNHPDKGGDVDSFQKINDAFDVISTRIERLNQEAASHQSTFSYTTTKGPPGAGLGMSIQKMEDGDVVVRSIKGSVAEDGILREDDVILSINGASVYPLTFDELLDEIRAMPVGAEVCMELRRTDKHHDAHDDMPVPPCAAQNVPDALLQSPTAAASTEFATKQQQQQPPPCGRRRSVVQDISAAVPEGRTRTTSWTATASSDDLRAAYNQLMEENEDLKLEITQVRDAADEKLAMLEDSRAEVEETLTQQLQEAVEEKAAAQRALQKLKAQITERTQRRPMRRAPSAPGAVTTMTAAVVVGGDAPGPTRTRSRAATLERARQSAAAERNATAGGSSTLIGQWSGNAIKSAAWDDRSDPWANPRNASTFGGGKSRYYSNNDNSDNTGCNSSPIVSGRKYIAKGAPSPRETLRNQALQQQLQQPLHQQQPQQSQQPQQPQQPQQQLGEIRRPKHYGDAASQREALQRRLEKKLRYRPARADIAVIHGHTIDGIHDNSY